MRKKLINKKNIILIALLVICIFSYLSYNIFFRNDNNISYALSRYGSNSEEVKQIQTKLKRWGYYFRRNRWNFWLKNFRSC